MAEVDDLRRWMDAVTEALNDLQASQVAQGTMLQALIGSHSDPDKLAQAWQEVSSAQLAQIYQRKSCSTTQNPVDKKTLQHFDRWTQRLKII